MSKFIYLANIDDNKEHLLHFQGKIDRQMAQIQLDSGISQNFINEIFVKKNNLKQQKAKSFIVELANK